MCGRFTLKTPPAQWGQFLLPLAEESGCAADWQAEYNIAPTRNILTISLNEEDQKPQLSYRRWGLIPSWAKDLSIGNRMINARSESLHEKRSFKPALSSRRCIIVADGYFEWQTIAPKNKQPFWISPAAGGLVLMAGLWETNRHVAGEPIASCTIVTTQANSALEELHDRMPAILDGEELEAWLDTEKVSADEAQGLLTPAATDCLHSQPVNRFVNNVKNQGEKCLDPPEAGFLF